MVQAKVGRGLVAFLVLGVAAGDAAGADVVLRGATWDAVIDPPRLGVEARLRNGPSLAVSAPRAEAARVEDLHHDGNVARWRLADEDVLVTATLADDTLSVEFLASRAGTLQWPTLPASAAGPKAFILPMFEGLYVPADDAGWAKRLVGESPLNTTAGLSMPFWGVEFAGGHGLTFVLTNPFNNELHFAHDAGTGRLGLSLTHAFTKNVDVKAFGFRIRPGDASPVTPAKVYRQHLVDAGEFVPLAKKIERTPDAAKLLGAPHVYLWGDGLIARKDVRDYNKLAAALVAAGESAGEAAVGRRVWEAMNEDARKLLAALPKAKFVDNFQKGQVVEELSRVLKGSDLTGTASPPEAISAARQNCRALYDAFPGLLAPVETWGDGFSIPMVQALADAGIDRAWLGAPSWDGLAFHPETVRTAIAKGYLIGPYDSFHSIHPHGLADTWETAQFDDPALFESGAIVNADGSKRKGFKQKGHLLSPAAARPHVERRVRALAERFRCNSWFVDCDAFGEVFDDYAPAHPMTQAGDAAARLSRMAWIRDTVGAVIGSEGGSAYAAPLIHFAHGIMTPVVAWGDADLMKNKQSKYYLGAYYPPDAPAIFFKQVPMKDEHRRVYADPRFRLPLYQTVFHDSVVSTHQWGYGSFKFADPDGDRELLELLYNVPPLYHLNLAEWQRRQAAIKRHFAFFSPLHREGGLLPMTDFRWLTPDRLVQRTTFGDTLEMTANFGSEPFTADGQTVSAHAILARRLDADGATVVYSARF